MHLILWHPSKKYTNAFLYYTQIYMCWICDISYKKTKKKK